MQSEVKKPGFWPLLLILVGTALVYLPTLRYAFVYDDRYQILRNPRIESWRYIGSYFLHHVWIHQSAQGTYYRPLFLIWLRLNHWIFGYHPLGWHATTVALHLVAIWLVYELFKRTLSPFATVLGTAIFALHPAHLESVAWISGVTDPLLALPLLSALLCWLRYRQQRDAKALYWSYGFTVLALLGKETAMLIPPLVFIYAFALSSEAPVRDRLRDAYRSFVPYFFIFASFWFARALILRKENLPPSRGLETLIANVAPLLWFYAKHLIGLAPIGIYYDFTPIQWSLRAGAISFLALIALLSLALVLARRSPELLIAAAWMLLPVAIASSAVAVFISDHDCVHDRYLYLSTIGFGMAIGHLIAKIESRSRLFGRPLLQTLGAAAALAILTVATLTQMPQWHDDLSLFARGIRTAPHNPMALKEYAYQLHLLNRDSEAQYLYERVIALDPTDVESTFALATIAFRGEQWERAINDCERARKLAPFAYVGCYRLESISLMNLGRLQQAEALARRAIARYPSTARQHVVLGEILAREGKLDLARAEFTKELEIGESGEARIERAKLTH